MWAKNTIWGVVGGKNVMYPQRQQQGDGTYDAERKKTYRGGESAAGKVGRWRVQGRLELERRVLRVPWRKAVI